MADSRSRTVPCAVLREAGVNFLEGAGMTIRLNFVMKSNGHYILGEELRNFSLRYLKETIVEKGFDSDGASGPAEDIVSEAWWIHDKLCRTKKWADGTPCSAWQRSMVLHDILWQEGRYVRSMRWFVATFMWDGIIRPVKEELTRIINDITRKPPRFPVKLA